MWFCIQGSYILSQLLQFWFLKNKDNHLDLRKRKVAPDTGHTTLLVLSGVYRTHSARPWCSVEH